MPKLIVARSGVNGSFLHLVGLLPADILLLGRRAKEMYRRKEVFAMICALKRQRILPFFQHLLSETGGASTSAAVGGLASFG